MFSEEQWCMTDEYSDVWQMNTMNEGESSYDGHEMLDVHEQYGEIVRKSNNDENWNDDEIENITVSAGSNLQQKVKRYVKPVIAEHIRSQRHHATGRGNYKFGREGIDDSVKVTIRSATMWRPVGTTGSVGRPQMSQQSTPEKSVT